METSAGGVATDVYLPVRLECVKVLRHGQLQGQISGLVIPQGSRLRQVSVVGFRRWSQCQSGLRGTVAFPNKSPKPPWGRNSPLERRRQLGYFLHASDNSNYEPIRNYGLVLSATRQSWQKHRTLRVCRRQQIARTRDGHQVWQLRVLRQVGRRVLLCPRSRAARDRQRRPCSCRSTTVRLTSRTLAACAMRRRLFARRGISSAMVSCTESIRRATKCTLPMATLSKQRRGTACRQRHGSFLGGTTSGPRGCNTPCRGTASTSC